MRDYWFPNIDRMADPATAWILKVLQQLEPDQAILAAVVFRQLGGFPRTFASLLPMFTGPGYYEAGLLAALGGRRPLFNPRVDQHLRAATLADVAAACEAIEASGGLWHLLRGASLREAHKALCAVHKIGPQRGYEMALDLYRTPVLAGAEDAMTWAYPSEQAVAGAAMITGEELGPYQAAGQAATMDLMKSLLEEGVEEHPSWKLSEIQRGLTLFYRWAREAKPTRRYRWR